MQELPQADIEVTDRIADKMSAILVMLPNSTRITVLRMLATQSPIFRGPHPIYAKLINDQFKYILGENYREAVDESFMLQFLKLKGLFESEKLINDGYRLALLTYLFWTCIDDDFGQERLGDTLNEKVSEIFGDQILYLEVVSGLKFF